MISFDGHISDYSTGGKDANKGWIEINSLAILLFCITDEKATTTLSTGEGEGEYVVKKLNSFSYSCLLQNMNMENKLVN